MTYYYNPWGLYRWLYISSKVNPKAAFTKACTSDVLRSLVYFDLFGFMQENVKFSQHKFYVETNWISTQDSLSIYPSIWGVPVLEFGNTKVGSDGGNTSGLLSRPLITCQKSIKGHREGRTCLRVYFKGWVWACEMDQFSSIRYVLPI